ncbi:hypothetical protein GQ457_11G024600 [Hibiscus cannabinus]
MMRRCVPEEKQEDIFFHCHSAPYGGNFGRHRIVAKVLQSCFYYPTLFKDTQAFYKSCDRCQCVENISRRNESTMQIILEVELFDVMGIDFKRHFTSYYGHIYILFVADYVSKWVEDVATSKNDARTVLKFSHKNIFTKFGVPRAIISDERTHFDKKLIPKALQRYGVHHEMTTTYHLQTNGQAEILTKKSSKS